MNFIFNYIKSFLMGIDENEFEVNFMFVFKIMGCYYIKRVFLRVGLIFLVNYFLLVIVFYICFIV